MKFKFTVSKQSGKRFAKKSKDYNKIHLNTLEGYNSIYGQTIIHGVNVFLKIIRKLKIKNFKTTEIQFYKPLYYDKIIKVHFIKRKNIIYISQENEVKSIIILNKFFTKEKIVSNKTKINVSKYKSKSELVKFLYYLTYFVGMIYPGKLSIISKIQVRNKSSSQTNNKGLLFYKKKKELIQNKICSKNFEIYFETIFRPTLIKKKTKLDLKKKKKLKNLKNNIIIIGASNGIGNEIFEIVKNNNNVKIFAFYNNNKINFKKKNLFIKKINIINDLNFIFKTIKENYPVSVYFCASPKIEVSLNKKNNNYDIFYNKLPKKILLYLNKISKKIFCLCLLLY
jgi:hypothetical protein